MSSLNNKTIKKNEEFNKKSNFKNFNNDCLEINYGV